MSEQEKLKIGDVVRLKSGGPMMTVGSLETAYEGQRVRCDWIADDGVLHTAAFASAQLTTK
jgi:uncharacterized protein YodC (DUF2158 family)